MLEGRADPIGWPQVEHASNPVPISEPQLGQGIEADIFVDWCRQACHRPGGWARRPTSPR